MKKGQKYTLIQTFADYRVLQNLEAYYPNEYIFALEQKDGEDALGVERWRMIAEWSGADLKTVLDKLEHEADFFWEKTAGRLVQQVALLSARLEVRGSVP